MKTEIKTNSTLYIPCIILMTQYLKHTINQKYFQTILLAIIIDMLSNNLDNATILVHDFPI